MSKTVIYKGHTICIDVIQGTSGRWYSSSGVQFPASTARIQTIRRTIGNPDNDLAEPDFQTKEDAEAYGLKQVIQEIDDGQV